MSRSMLSRLLVPLALGAAALLAGCERPPMDPVQIGYRGTGMEHVVNPRIVAKNAALHVAPVSPPPASADGPKAKEVFQNVKVLGDLSAGQFTGLMVAMTQWVAPEQGCNYCHNPQNLADDSVYTKVVARKMIQMTQRVNSEWGKHVGATGVTCYTCHRGNPVPAQVTYAPAAEPKKTMLGYTAGQNRAEPAVGGTSLPYDPFGAYLDGSTEIRVNGKTALPNYDPAGKAPGTKDAEGTFGLMIHMSQSLGVGCTFCHNTRSIAEWEGSPPQRMTAWYGIRMARELNNDYLKPLTSVFPANRKGPTGDVAHVACSTCHQGVNKPLNGAPMLKNHPELARPTAAAAKAEAPAPAAPGKAEVPAAPAPDKAAAAPAAVKLADARRP
jgi:photosynthetic reaction center cytochrome c subunit